MSEQAETIQPEPRSGLPESTPFNKFGKVVGFGLASGVVAGVLAFMACRCIISAFPIRGDDWTVGLPAMCVMLGLIDGAFCGYRRSRRRTESTERSSSGIGASKRPFSELLCSTGGYVVWAIFGLVVGGWMGVFRYGSFWGLLVGPPIAMGIRFVMTLLWGLLPSVFGLVTRGTNRVGKSSWGRAFKTAGVWVGVASVATVPCALVLPDPWSRSPIPMILWLIVAVVPVLLPVVSGCYYRSVKVAVAAAIMTFTIGCAVLVILLVVNLGAGSGPYF